MTLESVMEQLDNPQVLERWLSDLKIENFDRARTNLVSIAKSGITFDLFDSICLQLGEHLPKVSDPDLALNNLERFILAARSPLATVALLDRDKTALPILLVIFSTSQYLSDLLVRDTESYDYLRLTEGQLYTREIICDELVRSIDAATENEQAMQILRRYKQRETLRIAFGDLIVKHHLDRVAEQISFVAEAICEAALHFANKQLARRWGTPLRADGSRSQFVVFALGKLGGCELNYSSDIDLILVYEADGETESGKSNQVYFEKLTREFVKLITETTSLGAAYRVDLRLRPDGSKGRICISQKSFLRYYNLQGRTWERQALIKMRPIAGDIDLGNNIVKKLEPWIYHRTLNRFDIAGIQSLKRKIERRTLVEGEQLTNVKTGYGGIRDIEFVIQFLQLLNGGFVKTVRTHNTLDAIQRLASEGSLTMQEAQILSQNYKWLRKLEHRLQIMMDLQVHTLPESTEDLEKTAKRMGYQPYFESSAVEQFRNALSEVTQSNNQILNHLLHDAFEETTEESANNQSLLEADLFLDPNLDEALANEMLQEYGFHNTKMAFQNLLSLSREESVFLSSRRCRHFLAAVAKPLLEAIRETPDADATLTSLTGVSESIGAKGVLWELFSAIPAALHLFVRLCSSSDYLCSILRSNPGMIDELIDSLVMEELPTIDWLRGHLSELIGGAEELGPIVHSFKDVFHIRVGIRDIAGKDHIHETHRTLADVAQVTLEAVIKDEFLASARKHGAGNQSDDQLLSLNRLIVLALGKLGGREPNYHSDLDVVFLYSPDENDWLTTSQQHFYSDLAARITKTVSRQTRFGKLYELDSRLRPTGKSGALAVSFVEFEKYFATGQGQLWERQALCKARAIFGESELQNEAMMLVRNAIMGLSWRPEMADEVRQMRLRMQENCNTRNIKRGVGGTVDVEFAVQMLQIKFAKQHPEVLVPGTLDAIEKLKRVNVLLPEDAARLSSSYEFLRGIEARFRLMNTTARHDLPEGSALQRLAYLLRTQADEIESQVQVVRKDLRILFDRLIHDHSSG